MAAKKGQRNYHLLNRAMAIAILAFIVGHPGFIHLTWAAPKCLVLLLSVKTITKTLI